MQEIILGSPYGGLGDNIQLSTLPELYAKAGHDVYICSEAYFRNPEIKELIWECNPFVRGTKSGICNAGDTPGRHRPVHPNPISNWEILHGFSPTNTIPKIYYTPQKIDIFQDVFLVDFSSISAVFSTRVVEEAYLMIKEKYPDKTFRRVRFQQNLNPVNEKAQWQNGVFRELNISVGNDVVVNNIFEYCDIICSSFGFLSIYSGASHLSSALKEYNRELISLCVVRQEHYEHNRRNSLHLYDNIEYILVSSDGLGF